MRTVAAVVALAALTIHAGLWTLLDETKTAPEFNRQLTSVSYDPYTRWQDPEGGDRPTADQIRRDLRVMIPYIGAVRTYASTGGLEMIPSIAADFGLKVTVGAWIDKRETRNEQEIQNALDLARHNHNVNAIVVGNETILRGEKSVDEMIKLIHQVKRQSPVPVTTGEIWTVWLDHPELAAAVDFLAVHILPYWEGVPAEHAVDQAIVAYDKLRAAFPGKRIVIAEFGWPSDGYNYHAAEPGRTAQAMVLRDFVTRADAYGIDYNIIEAVDQPWKTMEGGVGPYWGIFDAARHPKFSWTGPVNDPGRWKTAGLALLLGLLFSLPLLAMTATLWQTTLLAAGANIVGMWFATVFAFWVNHYLVTGAAFALGLGALLLFPLVVIALARIDEIASVLFGHGPRRLIASPAIVPALANYAPKVSIHIPAHREPPEMLKATLNSVARLDYPNFECVVVINNTPDPSYWLPVEEHCRALGERFKFINAESLGGYKAGALRLALAHTAADAEIIGVIDADYTVKPEWLRDLVPTFADPRVGLIQAPQDHRDGDRTLMHAAMNGEYAGFFDIGMVQRNESNAIIVHGTMCLMRRAAMESTGGWSSDTICEDTDLGLSILEHGWQIHYTNKRYGHGLLPDTFEAFKKQRYRWAFGGFQILKKHWRCLLPRNRALSREQKREFALGWLVWLGAESLGVVVAILNLLWVPVVAFVGIAIPDRILTIPIVAAFIVALAHFLVLYNRRVSIPPGQMFGAVIAAMSVQWTVARAVAVGIWTATAPFHRTAKGGNTRKGPDFPAFWEAILTGLLLLGAATLYATNYKEIHEVNIFAVVLVVQSLPFLSATLIALIEGTRFNEFAYWTALNARFIRGLPMPMPKATAETTAPRPVEKQPELVQ